MPWCHPAPYAPGPASKALNPGPYVYPPAPYAPGPVSKAPNSGPYVSCHGVTLHPMPLWRACACTFWGGAPSNVDLLVMHVRESAKSSVSVFPKAATAPKPLNLAVGLRPYPPAAPKLVPGGTDKSRPSAWRRRQQRRRC